MKRERLRLEFELDVDVDQMTATQIMAALGPVEVGDVAATVVDRIADALEPDTVLRMTRGRWSMRFLA